MLRNDSQSNNLSDNVFWWKADASLPPFRIGADSMWQLDRRFGVDPDADEDDGDAAGGVDDRCAEEI